MPNNNMTYREKLKQEQPEAVGDYYTGGAARCPCSWGYERGQPCETPSMKGMSCRECWDQKMK